MRKSKRVSGQRDIGPMTTICGRTMGAILDQSLILGSLEFTVSGLAEVTRLTYKTVRSCLNHLENMEPNPWVSPTRRIGNSQAFKFNVENHMSSFVKWATDYQMSLNAQSNHKKRD